MSIAIAKILARYPRIAAILTRPANQRGLLAAIDQGLISVTNFVASLHLAREISPSEFGVYAVGFLLLHMVRAIQEGLVVQPLNGLGSVMQDSDFRRYVTSAALVQLLLSILLGAGAALTGWALTALGNDTLGPAISALSYAFFVWPLQEFLRRAFYARSLVLAAVVNTAVASVVRLTVQFWWGSQEDLIGISGIHAIAWGALIALLPGLWQARSFWTPRFNNVLGTVRLHWENGRWVLGSAFANWMALEVYPILTAGMLSFAAAGAYRALQAPVAPVHVILRATDTFVTPYAAKVFHVGGAVRFRRALRIVYLAAGVPIIGLLILASIFARPLLELLYEDTYLEFSDGMLLMALFYGLWFLYWPLQSAFKSLNQTRPIFIANLLAILIMLTVGTLAIRTWGVNGAIGGQALNAGITGLYLLFVWRRLNRSGLGTAEPDPAAGDAAAGAGMPAQPENQQES
jgi:O-antigen/teichoic acid export membrane protein